MTLVKRSVHQVVLACTRRRLGISSIICLLRDEGMKEDADRIAHAVDDILHEGDSPKAMHEHAALGTLWLSCLRFVRSNPKLAVIYYGAA